jgi:hypothetical protein
MHTPRDNAMKRRDRKRFMSHASRISGATLAVFLSATAIAASQIDPNIERVEAGLLPVAAERIGAPANIRDRMRAYGVPGVSIAVVDNGEMPKAQPADLSLRRPCFKPPQ